MDALHIGDPGCFSDRALGSREQEEPTGEACSWERGARMASPRHPHCLGNARAYYVGPFPDKGSQCAHTRVYMHTCTHTHLPLLPWSFPFLCCWEGAGRCFPSSFTETRCAQHIPCPAAPSVQCVPSRCRSPDPPYTRRASCHQVSQENASIRNPSPSRNEVSVIKMQTGRQDATARGDFQPTKNSPKPPPILQEREMTAREGGKPAWACLAVQAEARISRRMEMVGLEAL